MKANELRIGNYVKVLGETKTVIGMNRLNSDYRPYARTYIEFEGLVPMKEFHLSPIPLTEEWLLKFGFESKNIKSVNIYSINLNNELGLFWCIHFDILTKEVQGNWIGIDEYETYKGYVNENYISFKIKHVHQLQNLYFALTGEELKAL